MTIWETRAARPNPQNIEKRYSLAIAFFIIGAAIGVGYGSKQLLDYYHSRRDSQETNQDLFLQKLSDALIVPERYRHLRADRLKDVAEEILCWYTKPSRDDITDISSIANLLEQIDEAGAKQVVDILLSIHGTESRDFCRDRAEVSNTSLQIAEFMDVCLREKLHRNGFKGYHNAFDGVLRGDWSIIGKMIEDDSGSLEDKRARYNLRKGNINFKTLGPTDFRLPEGMLVMKLREGAMVDGDKTAFATFLVLPGRMDENNLSSLTFEGAIARQAIITEDLKKIQHEERDQYVEQYKAIRENTVVVTHMHQIDSPDHDPTFALFFALQEMRERYKAADIIVKASESIKDSLAYFALPIQVNNEFMRLRENRIPPWYHNVRALLVV